MGLNPLAWFRTLFGGDRNVVTEVAGVFAENQENKAVRAADSRTAAQMQYAQEFRAWDRSWFDRLIDGINRLPRPILAFATIWFFYLAMEDPSWFMSRMVALSAVPTEMWYLLGLVMTFYFGGRFQVKSQDFHKSVNVAVSQLPQIMETIDQLQKKEEPKEDTQGSADLQDAIEDGVEAEDYDDNPALQDWRPNS